MTKKEVLVISISIFLTVIAWLVADIIHASTREKAQAEINLPTFKNYAIDQKILEILERKVE